MDKIITPRYDHDCDSCVFLGSHRLHDLYFCPQHGIPTIIARFSDEPSDYYSGMSFGKNKIIEPLFAAYRKAVDRGLITDTKNIIND